MGAYENWTDLQAVIDVVAGETLLPADGMSETMVTAVVIDSSGNPVQNATVSWAASDGSIFPAQTTTNSAREATAILTSSTTHVMAAVSATSGGVTGNAYVQFGNAVDPMIWVVQPSAGAVVSGDVDIITNFCECSGSIDGILTVWVYVDGTEIDVGPPSICESPWRTYLFANGAHQVTATATDIDGNVVRSGVVTVTSQNDISAFSVTPADSVGLNQPVAISGLAVPGGWSIVVTDTDNNTVWTTSGTGTTISATWPGPTTDGYFTIAAVATATGNSAAEAVVCNPTQTAQFLMVSCVPEQGETRVIPALIDIANRRGLSYKVLTGSKATWANIKSALQNTGCKYLYMNCHGMEGGGSNALTFVVITGGDSNYWLYSHHWSDSPNGPQENDPIPANAPFRVRLRDRSRQAERRSDIRLDELLLQRSRWSGPPGSQLFADRRLLRQLRPG